MPAERLVVLPHVGCCCYHVLPQRAPHPHSPAGASEASMTQLLTPAPQQHGPRLPSSLIAQQGSDTASMYNISHYAHEPCVLNTH
jgi:hypothetical protein